MIRQRYPAEIAEIYAIVDSVCKRFAAFRISDVADGSCITLVHD